MKLLDHPRFGRRRMLQGLGTAALAYPFLRSLPSQAGGQPAPKRLLFFYSPNNSMDADYWTPPGAGTESALPAQLPEMLQPLQGMQDKLLVLGNLVMYTRDQETGPGGHVGMGHQLTGYANNPWPNQQQESEFWAGGISLDQFVASELGTPALTLAARPRGTNGGARISYFDADQPADPIEDPIVAFNQLFGDPDIGQDDQLAANQRQVRSLDQVAIELDRLKGKLASDDRDKLEIHLSHLLALQTNLESFAPADCSPEPPQGSFDYNSGADFPITARRHMDILAQSIACGVTRVGSIQNGNTGGAESYSGTLNWPSEGISYNRSQHVIAHDFEQEPNVGDNFEARMAIEKFYVSQYAYLLQRLDEIPEGDGTVLDNTLVVWTKGMGRGHSKNELLYLVAGGSGFPALGPGRFLDRSGEPHNNLLVTLANLMDIDIDTFGDQEICTGPLVL